MDLFVCLFTYLFVGRWFYRPSIDKYGNSSFIFHLFVYLSVPFTSFMIFFVYLSIPFKRDLFVCLLTEGCLKVVLDPLETNMGTSFIFFICLFICKYHLTGICLFVYLQRFV